MNATIVSIDAYPLRVGTRTQLLVKVASSDGHVGWGESGYTSRELAVAAAVEHLAPFILGQDPMRRGALWQEMYRSQYFEGDRVLSAAISAIDIALHDIAARRLGVPVYELLGGRQRDYVPLFATSNPKSAAEFVEDIRLLRKAGYAAMRLLPFRAAGSSDDRVDTRQWITEVAQWFAVLRQELGNDPIVGVDLHHRLTPAEAVLFGDLVGQNTVDFIEEPIRAESVEAYRALRARVSAPLAIGEEFASKWTFAPFIEEQLLDYVRVDTCLVGGLTEAVKVAAMAEAHYLDIMPHNPLGAVATAAAAHLAIATANFAWLEIRESPAEANNWSDPDIFPVTLPIRDGRLLVNNTPGLGVEVNEHALHTKFTPFQMPRVRKTDGSVANW